MIISDFIFQRLKSMQIYDGVYLFVSNSKQYLRDEAVSFAHSLLDYTPNDVALNEKIFMTDTASISVDLVNDFVDFESKRAIGVKSKILIFHDIELIKDNISDKMLKTIEDHNSDSLIVFTTTALENVSRTIRSRCMVFKEYTDSEDYFIQFRNKYLCFIDKAKEDDYMALPEIVNSMENLGSLNIIRAMFVNLQELELLNIAKRALDCYLTGSKESQVNTYLVNSVWCWNRGYRRWS